MTVDEPEAGNRGIKNSQGRFILHEKAIPHIVVVEGWMK